MSDIVAADPTIALIEHVQHKAISSAEVDAFIKSGANINGIVKDVPLIIAANGFHTSSVQALLDAGANINAVDSFGETALYKAVMTGNAALAKLLVERGANVKIANEYGDTPLHTAVTCNSAEMVKLLIDAGARIDVQNGYGKTPLDLQVLLDRGHSHAVKLLLQSAADNNLQMRVV